MIKYVSNSIKFSMHIVFLFLFRFFKMTKANLDKRIDDDGILLDAQLEWEHEEGKTRILNKSKRKERNILVKNVCIIL